MRARLLLSMPPRQRALLVRVEHDERRFSSGAREIAHWRVAHESQLRVPHRIDEIEVHPQRLDRGLAPRIVHHDVAPTFIAFRVHAVTDRPAVLSCVRPVHTSLDTRVLRLRVQSVQLHCFVFSPSIDGARGAADRTCAVSNTTLVQQTTEDQPKRASGQNVRSRT
jgi:hypothetical protein